MASLIPGYEYDIFISYRQKDNKHDGWVTEFVENLKGEIDATFKEDISIYFDENPHDRLQDTHNVDKSLEGKLKCLIFIPILSRTYCDPNSYAWQFEFLPFIRMASEDDIGRDIRLKGGNVASRIMPVRIHDLDAEDVKLFEKETGSVLRSLDFVFKTSAGVNRPLRANEDHPNENLNKTFYRDQVNKVAIAIKEIIAGIRSNPAEHGEKEIPQGKSQDKVTTDRKPGKHPEAYKLTKGKIVPAVIVAIIAAALVITNLKLFRKDKFQDIRDPEGKISIAVMPFENLTGDTTLNWFSRGISSLIINGLGGSSELAVLDDQTMYEVMESINHSFSASITPSLAREAAEKAKAETYITGSFQGKEGKYRILVNLTDTRNGGIIWTNKVEGDLNSSEYLLLTDSLCTEIKDYLEIKSLEQKADYDFREAYPRSAEAYRYFIEGVNLILDSEYKSAVQVLQKAIDIDSTFTFASFYMAFAYNFGQNQFEQATANTNEWIQRAYRTKDRLPLKYQKWLNLWHTCQFDKDGQDIVQCLNLLENAGIESRLVLLDLGVTYNDFLHQYNKAIEAYKKIELISMARDNDWKYDRYYQEYSTTLLSVDNPEEALRICETGLKVNPDNGMLAIYKSSCYDMLGDTTSFMNSYAEIEKLFDKYDIAKAVRESVTGDIYYYSKDTLKMEEHYRKAYNLDPGNRSREADLVYALVWCNINAEEGLERTEKILDKYPDISGTSWWKQTEGLAQHKLGHNMEALAILEDYYQKYPHYNKELEEQLKEVKEALSNSQNN